MPKTKKVLKKPADIARQNLGMTKEAFGAMNTEGIALVREKKPVKNITRPPKQSDVNSSKRKK